MPLVPPVLLTRPAAQSQEFAQQLQDRAGPLTIVISPILMVRFLDFAQQITLSTETRIIFTSRQGVAAWKHAGLPAQALCYAVGPGTGRDAEALGFEALCSEGTAELLLRDILRDGPSAPVLHVHGRHTRGDLVPRLKSAGLKAQGVTAYEQELADLTPEAQDLLAGGAPVVVPLFSPRSAGHFRHICPKQARPVVIAISHAAAEAWPDAQVAEAPSAEAMLEAVVRQLMAV